MVCLVERPPVSIYALFEGLVTKKKEIIHLLGFSDSNLYSTSARSPRSDRRVASSNLTLPCSQVSSFEVDLTMSRIFAYVFTPYM